MAMRIEPDRAQATRDEAGLNRKLRDVLARAISEAGLEPDPSTIAPASSPSLFAAAFAAQAMRRSADAGELERDALAVRLRQAAEDTRSSLARAQSGTCPAWSLDAAPAEVHLVEGLNRAKAQIPQRADRADAIAKLTIGTWTEARRAVLCEAACLLADVWPEMLGELATVVRQATLLDGFGIDGFTDFTTHGAVYVNAARFDEGADHLPPHVRVAEALVHEGTHNRCNAAAVSQPFLVDRNGSASLVETPLRSDRRPLTGLFQQLVVLVRCVALYDRLLSTDTSEPLRQRRHVLSGQARQAVEITQRHAASLTTAGRAVLAEAAASVLEKAQPQRP